MSGTGPAQGFGAPNACPLASLHPCHVQQFSPAALQQNTHTHRLCLKVEALVQLLLLARLVALGRFDGPPARGSCAEAWTHADAGMHAQVDACHATKGQLVRVPQGHGVENVHGACQLYVILLAGVVLLQR